MSNFENWALVTWRRLAICGKHKAYLLKNSQICTDKVKILKVNKACLANLVLIPNVLNLVLYKFILIHMYRFIFPPNLGLQMIQIDIKDDIDESERAFLSQVD